MPAILSVLLPLLYTRRGRSSPPYTRGSSPPCYIQGGELTPMTRNLTLTKFQIALPPYEMQLIVQNESEIMTALITTLGDTVNYVK